MDQTQLDQLNRLIANLDANLFSIKRLVRQLEQPSANPANGVGDASMATRTFGTDPFPQTANPNPASQLPTYPTDNRFPPLQSVLGPTAPQGGGVIPSMPPIRPAVSSAPSDQALPQQGTHPMVPPMPASSRSLPPLPQRTMPMTPPTPPTPVEVDPVTAPGVEGTFDGTNLITSTGEKIEVPSAYASKTRILFGDTVKMYDDNGEKKFKVMVKQPRKKLDALSTKKDNKWYALTGIGVYKISDSFADFNKLAVNDRLSVLVPEGNLQVPFAAIEEVLKQDIKPKEEIKQETVPIQDKKNSKMVEEYDLV